jgi:hypothetical protein
MLVLYYFVFALFTFIVVTVAGFAYLPWWQALLLSFGTLLALVYAGSWMVRWRLQRIGTMFQQMFKMKSQVLQGASIEVHSVTHAAAPARPLLEHHEESDEESEEEENGGPPPRSPGSLAWYCIDVTIIPKRLAGPMTHWDVDDLRLLAGNARVPRDVSEEDKEEDFELSEVEIEENGQFRLAEEGKYTGRQRLRFLVGLPRDLREAKFRYYFEEFGRISLPGR